MTLPPIEVSSITKKYGDRTALEGVSFTVRPGRITGLLGRNGAGKTSCLRIVLGLAAATEGSVRLLGVPPNDVSGGGSRLGFCLDSVETVPGSTVLGELTLWARGIGVDRSRIDYVLDLVELTDHRRSKCTKLSTGQRQRLRIATALLSPDVELLVFDEPTNGLDPAGARWFRTLAERLQDEGRTIVVSSHLLDEVEKFVDDVVILDRTVLFDGSLDELTSGGHASLESKFFELTARA